MKLSKLSVLGVVLLTVPALAFLAMPDVKYTQLTSVKFHGAMGTMMKLAGGSGPQTSTVMVSGNKQRTDNENSSTVIDLDREVMITLDHKKKEYTEMTFAEWREMMSRLSGGGTQTAKPSGEQPDVKFDVKVDRTGERQNISGYGCEKVIVTMTLEGSKNPEAGAPPGQGGKSGMVITSTQWVTPEVAGWEATIAFGKKFVEKLGMMSGGTLNTAAQSILKNPQFGAALKKLEEEGKKLSGVAVKTESIFETWGEPAAQSRPDGTNQPEEEKMPSSVGGLLGGLGKKMVKKPGQSGQTGSSPLFESTMMLQSVSTADLNAGLFAAPATYKRKEK